MKKINYKVKFGIKLKSLRKEHGLTQEELSEVMEISSQHLSYVESGRRGPSFEFIISASKALEIEPSELFYFEDKTPKAAKNPSINRINALLKTMKSNDLKKLQKIISIIWQS